MKYIILTFIMGCFLTICDASEQGPSKDAVKAIYKAATKYDVDAQDLVRIAFVESRFKVDAKRVNPNGTIDYGMFQINSVHWTTTCKGLDIMTLEGNAFCAAKLLSSAMRHAGKDKQWIGRYHSNTPKRKRFYAKLLAKADMAEVIQ